MNKCVAILWGVLAFLCVCGITLAWARHIYALVPILLVCEVAAVTDALYYWNRREQ